MLILTQIEYVFPIAVGSNRRRWQRCGEQQGSRCPQANSRRTCRSCGRSCIAGVLFRHVVYADVKKTSILSLHFTIYICRTFCQLSILSCIYISCCLWVHSVSLSMNTFPEIKKIRISNSKVRLAFFLIFPPKQIFCCSDLPSTKKPEDNVCLAIVYAYLIKLFLLLLDTSHVSRFCFVLEGWHFASDIHPVLCIYNVICFFISTWAHFTKKSHKSTEMSFYNCFLEILGYNKKPPQKTH